MIALISLVVTLGVYGASSSGNAAGSSRRKDEPDEGIDAFMDGFDQEAATLKV